jgi:LPXTG-site transpeptidase (sortase) family protein
MSKLRRPDLKGANNLLFALIVLINGYIIVTPLWPQVSFWWRSQHSSQRIQLSKQIESPLATTAPASPKANSLIVPAMLLKQPTLEGPKSNWFNLLKAGIWRWPDSSTPDKGGNTVFLAHRFSYTGPHGAFYYLNKLKPGDDIGVVWNGKTYTYTVVSNHEVSPNDTSVEDNTTDARLTLFTCTPLWHPVNRLVVVAKLKGAS